MKKLGLTGFELEGKCALMPEKGTVIKVVGVALLLLVVHGAIAISMDLKMCVTWALMVYLASLWYPIWVINSSLFMIKERSKVEIIFAYAFFALHMIFMIGFF